MLDQPGRADAGRQHLRPPGGGHRGQGQRPVRQDQQPGADQPEADDDGRRHASARSIRRSCPTCSTAASWSSWAATRGKGPAAIKLTGKVGKESKEFVYELNFPDKTGDGKAFVEQLWARRKVGYLLDQIRANGEKKELVDEVVALAKKYGITTPYTSYLIVPDGPLPTRPTAGPVRAGRWRRRRRRPAAGPGGGGRRRSRVQDFARRDGGPRRKARGKQADKELKSAKAADGGREGQGTCAPPRTRRTPTTRHASCSPAATGTGTASTAASWAWTCPSRRQAPQPDAAGAGRRLRRVYGRNCMEMGGVWIDEGFKAKTTAVTVKANSDAYFRSSPRTRVRKVFQLGNHLVWVAPSGTALVIDTTHGKEELTDAEIEALFVARK